MSGQRLADAYEEAVAERDEARAEVRRLRRSVRDLRNALERFGDHAASCALRRFSDLPHGARQRWYQRGDPAPECDCGYDPALSRASTKSKRKGGAK
jgi:hypothetical protein